MKKMYLMGMLALATLGTSPLTAQTAPPNDDICNAIPLQMNSTSAGNAYTNVGATAQSGEPTPDCWFAAPDNSVWFSFVAPASGYFYISTNLPGGSLDDTVIALYGASNGLDCTNPFAALTPLACNDDSGDNYLSTIFTSTPLTPGNTYYLQVDGYDSDTGTFGINLTDLATIGAPDCSTNPTSSVDGTTNTPGGGVNLFWDAPANAVNDLTQYNLYTYADAQGTNPNLVRTIDPLYGTSTQWIASAETVFWNAVPTNGTFEATGCTISSFTVAAAPLGAIAQTAIPITAAQLPYTSPLDNTNNYGNDYSNTDLPNVDANTQVQTGDFYPLYGNDVVYAFTPDQSGAYDVGLTELKTGLNYVNLLLFEGLPFHSVIGFHFASTGTSRSLPGLQLVAGTTYYVVVSTNNSSTDQPYKLSVKKTAKLALPAKAYLQAALLNSTDGTMRTTLWDNGTLPLTSPYPDAMVLDANVTLLQPFKRPVDWIWTELRDANDPKIVKEGRSALLLKDGSIVDAQNVFKTMRFTRTAGNYYLVLKHRNHLGVMTGTTVALSPNTNSSSLFNNNYLADFTNGSSPITYGTHAQAILNGITCALWAGNANGVTQVKFQGSGNGTTSIKDRVLSEAGNTSGSNLYSFTGMSPADVNLDGQIKYQGSGNDSTILKDIVLSHPGNTGSSNLFTIEEQLPEHND
jgi:hypothetical protein